MTTGLYFKYLKLWLCRYWRNLLFPASCINKGSSIFFFFFFFFLHVSAFSKFKTWVSVGGISYLRGRGRRWLRLPGLAPHWFWEPAVGRRWRGPRRRTERWPGPTYSPGPDAGEEKLFKSQTRVKINFSVTSWSDGGILTCVLFAVVVLLACCCSWICSSCCFCIRASCSRCCWYCSAVKAERDESLLPIWKIKIHTIIDNVRFSCWAWMDSYAEKHDRGVVMSFVKKKGTLSHKGGPGTVCERGMQRSCVWFDVALKYSADFFSSYC